MERSYYYTQLNNFLKDKVNYESKESFLENINYLSDLAYQLPNTCTIDHDRIISLEKKLSFVKKERDNVAYRLNILSMNVYGDELNSMLQLIHSHDLSIAQITSEIKCLKHGYTFVNAINIIREYILMLPESKNGPGKLVIRKIANECPSYGVNINLQGIKDELLDMTTEKSSINLAEFLTLCKMMNLYAYCNIYN